jgi:hypothetical protein
MRESNTCPDCSTPEALSLIEKADNGFSVKIFSAFDQQSGYLFKQSFFTGDSYPNFDSFNIEIVAD